MKLVFLLAPAALLCAAESGSLNGPAPAVVFDNVSRAARLMIGVPGSAYLASAVASDVDAALASPDGKWLAVRKDGGLTLVRGESSRRITEGVEGPMAWSADSAALAAMGAGRIWLVGADGSVTALAAPSGRLLALAASKSHAVAAMAGGIYLVGPDGAKLLAPADEPVSVAISGDDLYFADRARGEVKVLRGYAEGGDPALVSTIEDAVGVAVSRNTVLIAAGRKALGLRTGTFEPVFELDLDFEASGMDALNASSWLLNAGQAGPLQVLSIEDAPAVYFVPRGEVN